VCVEVCWFGDFECDEYLGVVEFDFFDFVDFDVGDEYVIFGFEVVGFGEGGLVGCVVVDDG